MQAPHHANSGTWIMFGTSLLTALLMAFYFFNPANPISHTGGAELVIITSISISIFSLLIYAFRHAHARWERICFYILIMILLLGTLFATFLLERYVAFGLLVLTLVGWFIQALTR